MSKINPGIEIVKQLNDFGDPISYYSKFAFICNYEVYKPFVMKGFIQKEFEEFNNDLRTRIISNTSKIYQRMNLSRRKFSYKIFVP